MVLDVDRRLQKLSLHGTENNARQDNRLLNGRQTAYMIYDNLRIRGTGVAILDCNGLPRVQLETHNLQGFDTKWDEVRISMTKVADEDIMRN